MASHESSGKNNNDYVNQLIEEKKNLNSQFSHAYKLLQQEIDRSRNPESGNDTQRNDSHVVVHTGKQIRLKVKVHIPVDEHPNFNFVGKLLGPKGSSLQHLQECSQTRMAILGRGSMRDKRKEEELRTGGDPKYTHLNEALHVEVSAYAPAAEAYRRVSLAFNELQRFLVPDPVPFSQEQEYYDDMRQPQYMNEGKKPPYAGGEPPHPRGGGGMPPRPPMGPPMGGMQGGRGGEGPPRGRSAQSTYPAQEAEEWGAPRPSPRRGGYNSAPAPPARSARSYEEPVSDYNNYGDGYGEYNSGNASGYYDYTADPEPSYNDGYADESRGPMRNAGAPRGGRNNARAQNHPYSGATRRGY